ncbi:MAG: ACP S-malonyltransferase [Candidatus Kapaibacteriales bacterium]
MGGYKLKTALLFSGQGSQYKGMLQDHFDTLAEAKQKLEKANDILGYDITDIMFDMESNRLTETRYTQPAIYLHSTLAFDYAKNVLEFDTVAGHSIGEYAALYAAGVIGWADGLKLVSKRGELMFGSGEKRPGTMFAVVGLEDEKVTEVCESLTNDGNIVVAANFNSPGQVVVSGDKDYLKENSIKFKEAGAKLVKELNVSGAFHSPLLEDAQKELASAIEGIEFSEPKVPIYQNVSAKGETDINAIQKNLTSQLTGSVRWTESLKNMQQDGIQEFIEIGPGKVLQGLVKRTLEGDISINGLDKHEDILRLSEEN